MSLLHRLAQRAITSTLAHSQKRAVFVQLHQCVVATSTAPRHTFATLATPGAHALAGTSQPHSTTTTTTHTASTAATPAAPTRAPPTSSTSAARQQLSAAGAAGVKSPRPTLASLEAEQQEAEEEAPSVVASNAADAAAVVVRQGLHAEDLVALLNDQLCAIVVQGWVAPDVSARLAHYFAVHESRTRYNHETYTETLDEETGEVVRTPEYHYFGVDRVGVPFNSLFTASDPTAQVCLRLRGVRARARACLCCSPHTTHSLSFLHLDANRLPTLMLCHTKWRAFARPVRRERAPLRPSTRG